MATSVGDEREADAVGAAVDAICLYVAGNAGPSLRARDTLAQLLEGTKISPASVEVIDVVAVPDRAFDDGILVTPTLRVRQGETWMTIVGDLADGTVLRHLIAKGG